MNATPTPNAQVNQVLQLDPATLLVDVNVRHTTGADATLTESVRELGVLQPIVAVRTAEGQIRVRYGHRRTFAAIAAERPIVPVVVVADEATDMAASVERLVTQWAENEHRVGLTRAEQAEVIGQLAAFGISPTQIARRTRTTRAAVDAALTVIGSETARIVTARDDLDLMQAAVVAEFDDDPVAVDRLVHAAKDKQFDHVVQTLRDQRSESQRRAAKVEELQAAGLTVVDDPGWSVTSPTRRLSELVNANGDPPGESEHTHCPGHAVYLEMSGRWANPDEVPEGADVDEFDEDGYEYEGDDEDDRDNNVVKGDAIPAARVYVRELVARPVCVGWAERGHRDRHGRSGSAVQSKELSPEEAVAAAEAERAHKLAQRRDVIASNKAWGSATTVRVEWLTRLLARKTTPKGSAAFIALALTHRDGDRDGYNRNALACKLLGRTPDRPTGMYGVSNGRDILVEMLDTTTETRAQVLTLAVILAGYEANTDTNSWRRLDGGTARYLSFLASQGYELSDIERRACGLAPRDQDEGEQGNALDSIALTD